MQVADGIFQVQLPLPFPLRAVNCYLLRDGAGWVVLDAGLNYAPGRAGWEAGLAAVGAEAAAIARVVLTHAHPDHYGMAGWLQSLSGAPVLLSDPERAFAQAMWHEGAAALRATAALFERHGMPSALMGAIGRDIDALREMAQPVPRALVSLAPGDELRVGGRRFTALSTPGHSDGHLAFYCAEERLLLCGDAVLMKISPNVGLWPLSHPNPLEQFLGTLERLAELDVQLALPGHGPPITSLRGRAAELRRHHAERLALMEAAVSRRATAFEVCGAVFPLQELSTHQTRFAMAETLAHLEYLAAAGRLRRVEDAPVVYEPRRGLH